MTIEKTPIPYCGIEGTAQVKQYNALHLAYWNAKAKLECFELSLKSYKPIVKTKKVEVLKVGLLGTSLERALAYEKRKGLKSKKGTVKNAYANALAYKEKLCNQ